MIYKEDYVSPAAKSWWPADFADVADKKPFLFKAISATSAGNYDLSPKAKKQVATDCTDLHGFFMTPS